MTTHRGHGILTRTDGAYEGVIAVSGFPYAFRVTKHGDGISVTISDTPPDPVADAAAEAANDGYLARLTALVAGG